MNKTIIACLLILGLFGWREQATLLKWKDQVVHQVKKLGGTQPEELAQEEPAASTPATPEGSPSPATAPQATADAPPKEAPKPVEVALPPPPEGVYYLTERVKLTTDAGIRAYRAGLEVKKVSEQDNLMTVSDGTDSFPVAVNKLTRDMALVLKIRQAESLAAAAAAPAAATPKTPKEIAAAKRDAAMAEAAAKANVNASRRQYLVQIENIDRQIGQLNRQINEASGEVASARSRGRSSAAGASIPTWQAEVGKLQSARADILIRLDGLKP